MLSTWERGALAAAAAAQPARPPPAAVGDAGVQPRIMDTGPWFMKVCSFECSWHTHTLCKDAVNALLSIHCMPALCNSCGP